MHVNQIDLHFTDLEKGDDYGIEDTPKSKKLFR